MEHMNKYMVLFVLIALFVTLATAACADDGFKIRGIKGLWWDGIDNYRKALPWLAEHDLNFLMLCYTSFSASGASWRSDYSPEEMAQFRELASEGKRLGVNICLSFNPGLWQKPALTYSSEQDYQFALRKIESVHALGVNWFAVCLDDINKEMQPADIQRFGTLQAAQTYFINRLWKDIKQLKPTPRLIFCPSAYTTYDADNHLEYVKAIGKGIDKGVYIFWTGPGCCSSSISAADAEKFGELIGRKPFVWDNYPVNDMYNWRPLMGPLKNRSGDLAKAVSGYIANPMKQWEISKIPLSTTADYLANPQGYNPELSIERVIKSYPPGQQRAIRLLVKVYGSSFWGEPGFPPKPRPASIDDAQKQLPVYRALRNELSGNPGLKLVWDDVRPMLEQDIRLLESKTQDRLVVSPLKAAGSDIEGGAGSIVGYEFYNRPVNLVYAKPSGVDTMRVSFILNSVSEMGAVLKLAARDDDSGKKLKIRLEMNGMAIYEGDSPFNSTDFQTKDFNIPQSVLRSGLNQLSISNLELSGFAGMPPWFMVSEVELISK